MLRSLELWHTWKWCLFSIMALLVRPSMLCIFCGARESGPIQCIVEGCDWTLLWWNTKRTKRDFIFIQRHRGLSQIWDHHIFQVGGARGSRPIKPFGLGQCWWLTRAPISEAGGLWRARQSQGRPTCDHTIFPGLYSELCWYHWAWNVPTFLQSLEIMEASVAGFIGRRWWGFGVAPGEKAFGHDCLWLSLSWSAETRGRRMATL